MFYTKKAKHSLPQKGIGRDKEEDNGWRAIGTYQGREILTCYLYG
jgi:hypothetical protein